MTDTDARTQTHHDTGEMREHGTAALLDVLGATLV